ncbi:MAG: efflux RND transporter periplasmic adaptor subunit [Balneolaceae bacterium]
MDRKIEKKTFTPKRIGLIVFGIALVALFLYSFVWMDTRSRLNVDRERLMIFEVQEGGFQEFIDITGTVQPIRTNFLDAVEGGVVQDVYLESGAMVEKGDTILVLSNSNLQLSVMQQEAAIYDQINNVRNSRLNLEQNHLRLQEQLANARTELDRLEPRYKRDSALYAEEAISLQQFEETRQSYLFQKKRFELTNESYRKDSLQMVTQLNQLDDSEMRMWRSLDGVQQILDNLAVTAPIDGQLTTAELQQGQLISQGERIGQVDVLDDFKVRANIDEFYLARIVTGLRGSFTFAGERHELVIHRVFPGVREGQFQVDMLFTSGMPSGLRRGQTARIRLELDAPAEAILVERGGFYQSTGGNWIYKIEENSEIAVRQPIRIGRGNPQYFEVLEGLQPGDKVITSSYATFGDNDVLVLK